MLGGGTEDHCGHVDFPCGCPNPPDPVQAYNAISKERDRLRAELEAAKRSAVDLHNRIGAEADRYDVVANASEYIPRITLYRTAAAFLRTLLLPASEPPTEEPAEQPVEPEGDR